MQQKRIAVFVPTLEGGGAERIMVRLANSFAERGHATSLIVGSASGPNLRLITKDVALIDLGVPRVAQAVLPLSRILRRDRPHALLSALTHANIVAIVARVLSAVGTRVVVSERGTISAEFANATSLASRLTFQLVRAVYPHADAISAVSHGSARDLASFAGLPESRITVIYNPFDVDALTEASKQPLNHPWFADEATRVIVSAGRLNEAKSFDVLLRAFSMVESANTLRLVILGEGELRSSLEALARELGVAARVDLPGFVDNPMAFMARAAVFVLSSRREGFPGALVEAMGCGTPVVATDCDSGPREILENGRWGRLVPVGDASALAHAISETLGRERGALPDVRQRAREFDTKRSVDAYLRLMEVEG